MKVKKDIILYVLNSDFKQVACVDYYISLNWKRKTLGDGECEVVIPITVDNNLDCWQREYYISRPDDEMVCQIQYVETQEGKEGCDTLLVKGADITQLILNKRIIWNDIIYSGSVDSFFRKLLDENFSKKAVIPKRRMIAEDGHDLIELNVIGEATGTESFSFKSNHENIGDVMASVCNTYRYGMLMTIERAEVTIKAQSIDEQGRVTTYDLPIRTDRIRMKLNLYKPSNRSNYVMFSERFDDVIDTNFTSEFVSGQNLILVGGEYKDDGSRTYQSVGTIEGGLKRNEKFYDAEKVSRKLNWEDFLNEYPMKDKIFHFPWSWPNGGIFVPFEVEEAGNTYTFYYYRVKNFKIGIQDWDHYQVLKEMYKDKVWSISDDSKYFVINECDIAIFDRDILNNPPHYDPDNPDSPDNEFKPTDPNDPWNGGGTFTCSVSCTAMDVLYSAMLMEAGYTEYTVDSADMAFSAEIDPVSTFKYKEDYIIGDYVGIYNKYGVKGVVQIQEVDETIDASGYHFDVSLSNARDKEQFDYVIYCTTDVADGIYISTDDGKYICL